MKGPVLRGRRVLLRVPRVSDRDEVLRLNRASRGLHRGLVAAPLTARQWVAYLARRRRPESPGFLVCRAEDGAIVGGININEIVRGPSRAVISATRSARPSPAGAT